MSVYVTAGTVGVAAGPLIGILVFGAFGIHGTGLLVVPGLVTGGYLLWRMRGLPRAAPGAVRRAGLGAQSVPVFGLAVVIAVMMSRSWTVNVFQAFTPTWYRDLGYGPAFYGPLATTLVLASAVVSPWRATEKGFRPTRLGFRKRAASAARLVTDRPVGRRALSVCRGRG